ncbi:hypothetical protein [Sinomonas sp. P47F7]|uniref:PIN-like domain-containing protein n=1 Tax=Sinomonas sp. P47F7 TaxID=3410987 RepID=UPI003BF5F9AE
MKFLLDECVSPKLVPALRESFRGSDFDSVQDREWRGTLDHILFPSAASEGYEVLVSLDHRILVDQKERSALRSSGLHFAAIHRPTDCRGREYFALTLAQLVSAVALIHREHPSAPTLFRLGPVPHERAKRLVTVEHL